MIYELPKAGDEFINTSDGKTRIVVRIDKRSGETNIVMKCMDCISSSKEYTVSEKQWKRELGFGSWKKSNNLQA